MSDITNVSEYQKPTSTARRTRGTGDAGDAGGTGDGSVKDLYTIVQGNEPLQKMFKENPVAALEAFAMTPLQTDKFIYRAVVVSLGAAIVISLVGSIYLAAKEGEHKIPEVLVAIGSASVGALAGLLAPSPKK